MIVLDPSLGEIEFSLEPIKWARPMSFLRDKNFDMYIETGRDEATLLKGVRRAINCLELARLNAIEFIGSKECEETLSDYLSDWLPYMDRLGLEYDRSSPVKSLKLVFARVRLDDSENYCTLDFAFSNDIQTGLRDSLLVAVLNHDWSPISLREEG